MGYYLNSSKVFSLYESEVKKPYFVDKTEILNELIPLVEQGNNHICITRPRRFGKSVMASMIGAFFSRGFDSSSIFDSLKIASAANYREHLNQHNVIYINFIKSANMNSGYKEFIKSIERFIVRDLRKCFPDVDYWDGLSLPDYLGIIHEETNEVFLFVFDEWDCIFHKDYTTDEDRKDFINWLAALTKDTGYVSLSYMTGVLPIAKYSSGSTINNFFEYTMATDDLYSEYFGFTDAEVNELYLRYQARTPNCLIEREDLRYWYDGYHTPSSDRMYNPRSVVEALTRNQIRSYWKATGSYSEISTYIINDWADVKKDVALMVAGEAVKADVEEFAATAMNLSTRNEILSAMVVYGFLNYEDGKVHIPNKELMDEFAKTIRREKNLGYIFQLADASERMLQATLKGDTNTMEEILQYAHDTETPLLDYNNETELTAIVNLVYLSARDNYYVERENKAGQGYVDFIFYPEKQGDDGIILELKVDDTPESAIQQIKDRKYTLKFQGKMAEKKRHTGRILMVGIGYSKKDKKHHCKIEILES
ncbi:MAG: ATP-binding protein [Lachnospiraceae bacterium]|nr:ATP-binding protein [Lachnospiraceae bacterium]